MQLLAYLGSIDEDCMGVSVEGDSCEDYILWESENWLQELRRLWIMHCDQGTALLTKVSTFLVNYRDQLKRLIMCELHPSSFGCVTCWTFHFIGMPILDFLFDEKPNIKEL